MEYSLEMLARNKSQPARELHVAIAKACGCWPLKAPSNPYSWNAELQVREELLDVEVLDDDGIAHHPWATFVTSELGEVLAVRLAKDPASFGEIAELTARLTKHREGAEHRRFPARRRRCAGEKIKIKGTR